MKACHAAALALVSWYLVTPPVQSGSQVHPKTWDTVSKHETYDECRRAQIKLTGAGYRHSLDFPSNSEAMRDFRAQCVRSDDPRVTGKWTLHSTKSK